MSPSIAILILGTLVASTTGIAAQRRPLPVQEGDWVRVRLRTSPEASQFGSSVQGTFYEIQEDTLVLVQNGERVPVDVNMVNELAVRRLSESKRNWWIGAALGGWVGIAIGNSLGPHLFEDDVRSCGTDLVLFCFPDLEETALTAKDKGGMLGMVVFGVTGLLVGRAIKRYEWVSVNLTPPLSPNSLNAMTLQLSGRWQVR